MALQRGFDGDWLVDVRTQQKGLARVRAEDAGGKMDDLLMAAHRRSSPARGGVSWGR